MNKLDQIKAEQLVEAEKTGINPYDQNPVFIGFDHATQGSDRVVISGGDGSVATLKDYQWSMDIDIGKIKAETTLEGKQRIKAVVLPTYLEWVNQYVEQGHDYPNDVAVQVMIWLLDTGDIEQGLKLALHLIKQRQNMPVKFDRNMMEFLCDFFYDWANEQLKAGHSASPYLDTLIETANIERWEMHPLFISKLLSMLAKHKELSGDYQQAFKLCEQAEAINPEKAGVKGLKERLLKHLSTIKE